MKAKGINFYDFITFFTDKIDCIAVTLESVIDIGQGISVGPGRFGKKNKHRALNKRRAWKIWKKE